MRSRIRPLVLVLAMGSALLPLPATADEDAGVGSSEQSLDDDVAENDAGVLLDAGSIDASSASTQFADAGKYTPAEPGPSGARCHDLMHDGEVEATDCWTYCTAHAARLECLHFVQRRAGDERDVVDDDHAVALWRADGWMAIFVSVGLGYLFWRISQLDKTGRTTLRGFFVWLVRRRTTNGEPNSRESTPAPAPDGERPEGDPYLVRAFQTVAFIPALLLTAAHLYGISSYLLGYSYLADFARPSLVIIGMMSLGVLFGGLFGLPNRKRANDEPAGSEGAEHAAPNGRRARVDFGDRLEEVADWLTKLILGASLTQIQTVWENGDRINEFFSHATGMRQDYPLGTVLAVASLGGGFLLGYASTLLFLPVALHAGMQELDSIKEGPKPPRPAPKAVEGQKRIEPVGEKGP